MMTDDLVYSFQSGVACYPYPGTVLIYKDGEGAPVFDDAKAKEYREKAIARVLEFCQSALGQWRALGI